MKMYKLHYLLHRQLYQFITQQSEKKGLLSFFQNVLVRISMARYATNLEYNFIKDKHNIICEKSLKRVVLRNTTFSFGIDQQKI